MKTMVKCTDKLTENPAAKLDTWPKVLEYNFQKYGDRSKAMRRKHYGIWQSYSWQDYYTNVKYLALGLLALGFKSGDKLLIVGDNAPEWYFAELAAQCNHGISVGLYSDLSAAEIKYVARNSEAGFAIVEDQEQVDKLLQIQEETPQLRKIIYWRYKGLANQKNNGLIGYRDVLKLGREYEATNQGIFERNVASGKADDVCAIIYTSGTTGQEPRGAVHSYRTLRCASDCFLNLDRWKPGDNLVSNLPPAWITEQWLTFGCHLLSGAIMNFAESVDTQQQDIREIGPTMVLYSSRLWERQAGKVQARILGAGWLKKLSYRWFMPVGYRLADRRLQHRNPGWHWQALSVLANLALLRPIRDSLGLPHARACYSTGATLCPDTIRFYQALNIPLKSLYGSTEAGVVTGFTKENMRLDTVGKVIPGTEIQIAPNSEILVRHPGLFLGYYNNPAATASVLKDGWLSTGDSGRLTEDGHLVFLDRQQDRIPLANGGNLLPQDIESRMRSSPYIKDAWVMAGPDRSFASAVVVIDSENAGRWADKRKVSYTTYSDLTQRPEIYQLIEQEIARINRGLAPDCRIKRFVNLHKEFDPDEAELTRTRKLRRWILAEKYCEITKAIYSNLPQVEAEIQVRYQDGRTGRIRTALKIQSVKEGTA